MDAFVCLDDQKEYSRIQHDALDFTISTIIEAASANIKRYLKGTSPYEEYEDSSAVPIVRAEVRLAVLVEVDRYLKLDTTKITAKDNYISDAAIALLYQLRDPTFL